MNYKKLARLIVLDAVTIKDEFVGLKASAEKFVNNVLNNVKKNTGQLPTEKDFLKLVAEIIHLTVIDKYIPNPWKFIVKKLGLVLKALKLLDKYVLDKWFGKNWFFNLSYKFK